MTTATTPRLRGDRDFGLFYAARLVAVLGATITQVALPLLVWQRSGSAWWTSAVTAVQVVPYLIFGLLAGSVADRVRRRPLMVSCQLGCAVALASIPLAHRLDVLTVAQILAAAVVLATLNVWFDAGTFGALPALVGKERIVAANSAIWTSATVIGVAGPALAGGIIALAGAAGALWVDAAGFLVAAGCLLIIRRGLGPDQVVRQRTTIRADIVEGLRFIRSHPVVRPLTLLGLGNSITGGCVTGLLVVWASGRLGLADAWVPAVMMITAVGGLAASISLPWLAKRLPVGWITISGLTLHPVAILALLPLTELIFAAVPLIIWSASHTLVILNGITARTLATPDHLQARVNTTARMIAWGGTPLGALAGGAIAQLWSVPAALGILAIPAAIAAVLAWRSPLRRRELAAGL